MRKRYQRRKISNPQQTDHARTPNRLYDHPSDIKTTNLHSHACNYFANLYLENENEDFTVVSNDEYDDNGSDSYNEIYFEKIREGILHSRFQSQSGYSISATPPSIKSLLVSTPPSLSRGQSTPDFVVKGNDGGSSSSEDGDSFGQKRITGSISSYAYSNNNDDNNECKKTSTIDPHALLQEIRSIRHDILHDVNKNDNFNHHTLLTPDQADDTPTNIVSPKHDYSQHTEDLKNPSPPKIDAESLLKEIRTLHDDIIRQFQQIHIHNVVSNVNKAPVIVPYSSPPTRQQKSKYSTKKYLRIKPLYTNA